MSDAQRETANQWIITLQTAAERSQAHFIFHKCQSKHTRAGLKRPSVSLSVEKLTKK